MTTTGSNKKYCMNRNIKSYTKSSAYVHTYISTWMEFYQDLKMQESILDYIVTMYMEPELEMPKNTEWQEQISHKSIVTKPCWYLEKQNSNHSSLGSYIWSFHATNDTII